MTGSDSWSSPTAVARSDPDQAAARATTYSSERLCAVVGSCAAIST